MDKFLLLVRRYLAASFKYLARRNWDSAVVGEYMTVLSSIPLRYLPFPH
jgi:ribosomal RNA-processing protein 1